MTLPASRKSDKRPLRDSDILPCSDGVPMETTQHRVQMNLLIETLKPYLAKRSVTAYVAGNNFLYYQKGRPPKFCGPDFYVVLGREETDQNSYVVWEEDNRFPDVIVELVSPSTEQIDRGAKFIRYRDLFRTPYYYLYDPISQAFEGYYLKDGRYIQLPSVRETLPCQALGLSLGVRGKWLRWIQEDGTVLPTGDELAEHEFQRAEEERQRAEEERQRAERAEAENLSLRQQIEELRRLQGES